jgi:hypothetical protein
MAQLLCFGICGKGCGEGRGMACTVLKGLYPSLFVQASSAVGELWEREYMTREQSRIQVTAVTIARGRDGKGRFPKERTSNAHDLQRSSLLVDCVTSLDIVSPTNALSQFPAPKYTRYVTVLSHVRVLID